ncbi:hypothetical protein LBMAG33_2640 [Candidatus Levyibacteriota bacterium]|nr:cupin [Candidatus Levybacteria bacterium]MSU25912.1 cupin [Candidatus Levybacteria bacterium]GDX61954.1 hypothetical protein LBMAG33_2640 [Candidatus Levybacteria bacterium]
MIDFDKFDKSNYTNKSYAKKIIKPWGYEIHWVEEKMPYMGKILHIDAGKRLSLQLHDQKQESYWLLNGECNLVLENSHGELETIEMEKGKGYTTKIGQRHRHQAISDCDIIEVSSPETGTTYRLDDDYKRINETPDIRKKERGEI